MIQRNVNIFTQTTLYPAFILEKNQLSPQRFSKHPLFTTFTIFKRVMFVILQVNADFLINQLTKYFYTRQLNFLLHFLLVLAVDEMSCISQKYQPPNNLAKHQYFYTRDFISLLHFGKKIGALHRKRFSKHPLFTTFSIFLKVSEVCIISSKY